MRALAIETCALIRPRCVDGDPAKVAQHQLGPVLFIEDGAAPAKSARRGTRH